MVWFLYYEAVSKVSDFMNEPTVVFDDVNPYTGMRGMLVRRGGEAVDVVPLLGVVPDAANLLSSTGGALLILTS